MKESASAIFKLLTVFQRKNRFAGTSSGTDLGLVDSHLLSEIQGAPGCRVTELVSALAVDASMISRSLKGLEERKYVTATNPESDRRQRCLFLTGRGEEALATLDKNANALLEAFVRGFKTSEVKELSRLLLVLAEGLDAPPTCVRPVDHALRPGLRRLARAIGILSERHLDLPISSSSWQVLLAISEQNGVATPASLEERLRIHQSTISRILSLLVKSRCVSQKPDRSDRRTFTLSVTEQGRKLIERGFQSGSALIKRGLNRINPADAMALPVLLERLVFGPGETLLLEDGATISAPASLVETKAARAFLVTRLVEGGLQNDLDGRLIDESQSALVLRREGEWLGIAVFADLGRTPVLEHLAATRQTTLSWHYPAFIKLSFRRVLNRSPEQKLLMPHMDRYILPSFEVEWLSRSVKSISLRSIPFP